jgi:hypothetical protein
MLLMLIQEPTFVQEKNQSKEGIAKLWSGCFAAHFAYNRIKKFQHIV